MHHRLLARFMSVLTAATISALVALPATEPKLEEAASFTGPTTPWSVTAGLASRRMNVDYSAGLPSGVPWLGLLGLGSAGRGDVGLFDGSGTRHYDNGQVGGFAGSALAEGIHTTSGQLRPTGRTDVFGAPVYELAFNSYAISHSLTAQTFDLPGDSDQGLGAFVRFSGSFGGWRGFNTGLSVGWTGVKMSSALRDQLFGRFIASEHRTDYGYAYDAFFTGPPGSTSFLIFDGASLPGFADPRRTARQTQRVVDQVDALFSSDLNVTLNEVAFTFDVERYLTPRFAIALSAGPTLNAVTTDFAATATYASQRTGRALLQQSLHDSHTHVVIGFTTQLMVRYDLTPRRVWYLEAHAGYHWLPNVDFAVSRFGGDIDLSSWDIGIGLGRRF